MMVSTVELPEPFRTALAGNRAAEVCDAACDSPAARFGRGLARSAVGRDAEAREDFEAALAALGDACLLELAFLDQKQHAAADQAVETARQIADRTEKATTLHARAWHVLGLAHMRSGNPTGALDALVRGAAAYGELHELAGRASVYDSLGMAQADAGFVEDAIHYFALSLVDKTLVDDRYGMAITLGNLGRLHLAAGRTRDAIACFERDLQLSIDLADERGVARMHEDLGRAYLELHDYERAIASLEACRKLATARKFVDLQFFAHKDLALVLSAQGDNRAATAELDAAEKLLAGLSGSYFPAVLAAARGSLLAGTNNPAAIAMLEQAITHFQLQGLGEMEIAARVSLAKALAAQGAPQRAQPCILAALGLAHRKGWRRWFSVLNEQLASLGLVEAAADESARRVVLGQADAGDNYVMLARLGSGTYGEVFRVYDPRRGEQVAFKRLLLQGVYAADVRDAILRSARLELDVASRVRHPGVARVHALGTEPDGNTYVVQEFIAGGSLRERMLKETRPSVATALRCLARVAHALSALHDVGVCHRDLKPDNIMLRDDGSPVLIDFGVAHFIAGADRSFAGTLEYSAPEQLAGKTIDGRADLYALGVTAYEWLCGLRPYAVTSDKPAEAGRLLWKQPTPRASEFRADVSDELDAYLSSLLAMKPRHRPATARDVAARMESLADAKM